MNHNKLKSLTLISILMLATIACGLITSIQDKYNEVVETVDSVSTDIKQGKDILGTAQAFATQAFGSEFMETAQAFATEFSDSNLMETGEAFATEVAGGLYNPPQDIPIIAGDKEDYKATKETVFYITDIGFAQVADFYKLEMPANGWEAMEGQFTEVGEAAFLFYEKPDKKAIVIIDKNADNTKTMVTISIQPK